jgi:peptidoglycan/xylan/chitin deacetylase (PgdA/CDA1 family)
MTLIKLRALAGLIALIAAGSSSQTAAAFEPLRVAITVDDLPSHANTLDTETRLNIVQRFIAVLQKHRVGETYGFVNAKKVQDEPGTRAVLVEWSKHYPLGNHTYSHMDLNRNSAEKFLADVRAGEPLLRELSQGDSYLWFRYPFLHEGETLRKRNAVRADLANLNYRIAQVTIDFQDWEWNDPYVRCYKARDQDSIEWLQTSYIKHAIYQLNWAKSASLRIFKRPINQILLLHIGVFESLTLDKLLAAYEQEGVQFISLAEASADPAFSSNPNTVHAADFLEQFLWVKKMQYPEIPPLPLGRLESICQND